MNEQERRDAADAQYALGMRYSTTAEGDQQDNLQRAILCFQAALEGYRPDTAPIDWAKTHQALGIAYRHLLEGDRQQNLRQSLSHLQISLEITTRELFAPIWAEMQYQLGLTCLEICQETSLHSRSGIEADMAYVAKALHYLQAALDVYTFEAYH